MDRTIETPVPNKTGKKQTTNHTPINGEDLGDFSDSDDVFTRAHFDEKSLLLEEPQEKPPLINSAIYTLSRVSPFQRLAETALVKWYLSEWRLLTHRNLVLDTPDSHANSIKINAFFQGIEFFNEKIWGSFFSALLAHDFIQYARYPDQRFGNTLTNIPFTFWRSLNQETLSTFLVTNPLRNGAPFFLPWYAGTLLGGSLLSALTNLVAHYVNHFYVESIDLDLTTKTYDPSLTRHDILSILLAAEHQLVEKRLIQSASLLQDPDQALQDLKDKRTHTIELIESIAYNSGIPASYYAFSLLANRLDSMRASSSENVDLDLTNGDIRERKQIKTILEFSSDRRFDIRGILASYFLWSTGEYQRFYEDAWTKTAAALSKEILLFFPYLAFKFYVKARLIEAISRSIASSIYHVYQKRDCEQQGKQLVFMPQVGREACLVCPDWKNVSYRDMNDPQRCLNAFLSHPRSDLELLAALEKLIHFNLSHLDLSHQNWPAWNVSVFNTSLRLFQNISTRPVSSVNLSAPIMRNNPLSNEFASVLQSFFQAIPIEQLDLSNQLIGNNASEVIYPSVNPAIQQLFLSRTLFSSHDESLTVLSTVIPLWKNLTVLDLSHNQFNARSFSDLLKVLTVTHLYLRESIHHQPDLDALNALPASLKVLDLSNNDFSNLNLSSLANPIANGSLTTVAFSNTNMKDQGVCQLTALIPSNQTGTVGRAIDLTSNHLTAASTPCLVRLVGAGFTTLTIPDNHLTDQGLFRLSRDPSFVAVQILDISKNDITDQGFIAFAPHISQNLTSLRAALNSLSVLGMDYLAPALVNMIEIDLSHNALGDEGTNTLFSALLSNNATQVQIIRLAQNHMTGFNREAMIAYLNTEPSLSILDLADNPFRTVALEEIIEAFANTSLQDIDLSRTGFTDVHAKTLGNILPLAKNLSTLRLSKNLIHDQGGLNLALPLFGSVPGKGTIGNLTLSNDLTWAISQANATSQVKALIVDHNAIGNEGGRALCRASLPAHLEYLDLQDNPIDKVDLNTCATSSGERSLAIPVIYRVIYRSCQGIRLPVNDFLSLIFQTTEDLIGDLSLSDITCLSAASFYAFRQEIYERISLTLPKTMKQRCDEWLSTKGMQLIDEILMMVLRHRLGPRYSYVLETLSLSKQQYTERALTHPEPRKRDALDKTGDIAYAIGHSFFVLGAAALAFSFIVSITENPTVGLMVLPLLFKWRDIERRISQGYQRHGFFGAAEGALDGIAFSAPGGRMIEQTLRSNEHTIRQ